MLVYRSVSSPSLRFSPTACCWDIYQQTPSYYPVSYCTSEQMVVLSCTSQANNKHKQLGLYRSNMIQLALQANSFFVGSGCSGCSPATFLQTRACHSCAGKKPSVRDVQRQTHTHTHVNSNKM